MCPASPIAKSGHERGISGKAGPKEDKKNVEKGNVKAKESYRKVKRL